MRGLFKIVQTAILPALLGLCLFTAEARGQDFSLNQNPRPAEDFTLKDLKGIPRSLSAVRGKTVLLHFWASWCKPCREEFPALKKLWDELGGSDFVILAVAEDSLERVAPIAEEYGVDFPVLIDQYGGVMRSYGVSVIPVSVVIDREGMIGAVFIGPREYGSPEARKFFEGLINR